MKVILLEELPGRGGEGDVIDVARGYANNYLLTQGIAVLATKGNLKQLEQRRKNIAKREEVRISNAEAMKAALENGAVIVKAKVGDEGQLFGSVTAQMIAAAIAEQKELEVDRRRIDVRKAIKTVGEHVVEVALYREIKANVTLNVVDEKLVIEPVEEVVEEVAEEAAEEIAEEAAEVAESVETEVAE